MAETRILVVEDEPSLGGGLVRLLEEEAYAAHLAADGESAAALDPAAFALVILDLNIPPPTGLELLERWRGAGAEMPILILTARDGVEDRVRGLDAGADDYLTKPFSFAELLARVRSLLRRGEQTLVSALEAGPVAMDRAGQHVAVGGEPVSMGGKEFSLLEYLLLHKDQVVTREALSEHVWDDTFDSMTNVVDVTVYRLRKRLERAAGRNLIETVKGVGYVLRSAP